MRVGIALLLSLFLIGCSTTYYQVNDPSTGSTYYTTELKKKDGGALKLKDARTNAEVTIQTSEVIELTEDQYDAAVRTGDAQVAAP